MSRIDDKAWLPLSGVNHVRPLALDSSLAIDMPIRDAPSTRHGQLHFEHDPSARSRALRLGCFRIALTWVRSFVVRSA